MGAIVKTLDIPYFYTYDFFCLFSFTLFSVCVILLANLIKQSLRQKNTTINLCIYLFCSSSAVVFLSHSVGYFDHIGLLATLTILNIPSFKHKLLFALPAVVFCLYTHEAALIIFFPVIFISLLNASKNINNTIRLPLLIAFSVICLSVTYVLSQATLSQSEARNAYETQQSSTAIKLRPDAYRVLHRHGADNIEIMKKKWLMPKRAVKFQKSVGRNLPTALFISLIML
ncbi:MAG: hypothetical protein KUG73_13055, partial [Pseudomonadales bacterium]|nr:hypothetical protein [Pseudomonadales bacterium]